MFLSFFQLDLATSSTCNEEDVPWQKSDPSFFATLCTNRGSNTKGFDAEDPSHAVLQTDKKDAASWSHSQLPPTKSCFQLLQVQTDT